MDDASAASEYTGRCLWIRIRRNDKMILRKIIFVSLILRENYSSSSFSCFNKKKTKRNFSVMKFELMPELLEKKQQPKTQKTSPGWFFAPSFARHFVYKSELMFECSNDVAVVRNRCRLFYDIIACLKRSLFSQHIKSHDNSSEERAPRKWMNSALLANYWNENCKWWCEIEWINKEQRGRPMSNADCIKFQCPNVMSRRIWMSSACNRFWDDEFTQENLPDSVVGQIILSLFASRKRIQGI